MCIINCNSVLGDSYVFGNSFHQPLWCWACRRVSSSSLSKLNAEALLYLIPQGRKACEERERERQSLPLWVKPCHRNQCEGHPRGPDLVRHRDSCSEYRGGPCFPSGGHLNKGRLCFGTWHRLIWGYHFFLFLSLPPYLGLPIYPRGVR